MLTNKDILDAVIAKANSADEAMLISMLEARPQDYSSLTLNKEDIDELKRTRQQRIDGECGSTLEEVVERIKARRANA